MLAVKVSVLNTGSISKAVLLENTPQVSYDFRGRSEADRGVTIPAAEVKAAAASLLFNFWSSPWAQVAVLKSAVILIPKQRSVRSPWAL